MPIAKYQLPDGRIAKYEFPEGTTPEQAQAAIEDDIYGKAESKGVPNDETNPLMNAVRGFSARGNQAMTALNPWVSEEALNKRAAEQEWVKNHKGAGVGSMLADMAITAPAGFGSGAAVRSLATGAIEGLTHSGNLSDKIAEMGYGTLGAGTGEGLASALGFLARPFTKTAGSASDNPITETLKQKANNLGIKLNAAQETGNKSLQYLDSALDFMPSSSGAQKEFKDAQRLAWQGALFDQGGESANRAGQDVMGSMKNRISDVYNDVASRNNLVIDPQFKTDLDIVKNDLMGRIPVNQKSIVKSYLRDFDTAPQGAQISGAQYQEIRSMLDKQAKAFKNSDPATYDALSKIRSAADSAMERNISPDDALAWKQANNDWSVMRTIEKGVDPTTGDISPNLLINALKQRDYGRVIYGKGDQSLNDIAKVGKAFISGKTADSGTAQRQSAMKFLSGASAGRVAGGIYAGDLALDHDPVGAATPAIASGLAAILFPKIAGQMMRKQGGYLSKGLVDMGKEVVPGLTRQRLLSELGRNAGTQTLNEMRR